MGKRANWLGAWNAFSKAATKNTVRTQKKVGKVVSKAVGQAVGQATATQTIRVRAMTRRARSGALSGVLNGVASPVELPSNRGSGHWEDGRWGLGPLAQRSYRLFTPQGVTKTRPAKLLVLLHGCGQDAASFAASTHAATMGRAERCLILLPEQSSQANSQRCWNWFRSDPHVASEAMLLMAIIERVCARHAVQREGVYLIGMSAGGSMALTLALRFPERFAGVMSHSGAVPHSARNAIQAAQALHGHRAPDAQRLRLVLGDQRLPPLLLIHGDADRIVAPDNALMSVGLWLELLPRAAYPIPSPGHGRDVQRGARRAYNVIDWQLAGEPYVRLIRVAGLGHAWSGGAARQAFSDPSGPDALKLAGRFFADIDTRAGARAPANRQDLTLRVG